MPLPVALRPPLEVAAASLAGAGQALDRFNSGGRDVIDLTLVEPIVVEISADVAMTGCSFRPQSDSSGRGPSYP